jgi:hypothetical protein
MQAAWALMKNKKDQTCCPGEPGVIFMVHEACGADCMGAPGKD